MHLYFHSIFDNSLGRSNNSSIADNGLNINKEGAVLAFYRL
jgi:hypothetical protein